MLQIDHTPVDLVIVDNAGRRPIGRPWLTLALDVHTRTVAGFLVSLDPPSATSVALALAHTVLPKEEWLAARGLALPWPVAGLPRSVDVDNVREFHSRAVERGCREHGIRIDYRLLRTPRHGGHVERLMGTLMRCVHALPGTTFSGVRERGDADPDAAAVLILGELEAVFALEVLGPYHLEMHSALGVPPLAAWMDGVDRRPVAPAQPADAAAFFRGFLPFREVAVRREGIWLHRIFYYDDVLTTWLGVGRRLRVRYDPRDLSCVFPEDPAGRHWPVRYRDLGRPPIALREQRPAVKGLRARGKGLVDEQRIFDAIEARRARSSRARRRGPGRRGARRSAPRTSGRQRPRSLPRIAPAPPSRSL